MARAALSRSLPLYSSRLPVLLAGGCGGRVESATSVWLARAPLAARVEDRSVAPGPTMAEREGLLSVDYEVFGRVQGVFFRKHTQAQGKKLGVVGWVQNTDHGTVQGQIQGPSIQVRKLQEWLQKTGSPKSHIDKAEFQNEKKIVCLEHSDFCIVK